jgi:hypothetical protein
VRVISRERVRFEHVRLCVHRRVPSLGNCGIDGRLDDNALLLSTVEIGTEEVARKDCVIDACSSKCCNVVIWRLADSVMTMMSQCADKQCGT